MSSDEMAFLSSFLYMLPFGRNKRVHQVAFCLPCVYSATVVISAVDGMMIIGGFLPLFQF
jgi:hypothetical protein